MIGIFGDSFADYPKEYVDLELSRIPWLMRLQQLSDTEVESHSRIATSSWFSYKKFLNNYKAYDTIIFCYSYLHRWQHINADASIYHICHKDQLKFVPPEYNDIAESLVNVYEILHDSDLDKLIFQSIFDSVNNLCDNEGIKIINILSFEEIHGFPLNIDISKTNNTVLTNLAQVSRNEYLTLDSTPKNLEIYNLITQGADKRFCHLSPYNNNVLAEIVYNCMKDNTKYINLGKDNRFSDDVEHLAYLVNLYNLNHNTI